MRFEAYRNRLPLDLTTAFVANLPILDVLVHKTGDWGFTPRHAEIKALLEELNSAGSEFHQLPRTFALPDGSQVLLYARTPAILEAAPATHEASVTFGDAARFLGFDYSISGQDLTLTYHWQSLAPTDGDDSVFVHLINPATDDIVVQDDHVLFQRLYPTSVWQPEKRVVETRQITIPVSYEAPSLVLRLGLYSGSSRLSVTASAPGVHVGPDYADVGTIDLRR